MIEVCFGRGATYSTTSHRVPGITDREVWALNDFAWWYPRVIRLIRDFLINDCGYDPSESNKRDRVQQINTFRDFVQNWLSLAYNSAGVTEEASIVKNFDRFLEVNDDSVQYFKAHKDIPIGNMNSLSYLFRTYTWDSALQQKLRADNERFLLARVSAAAV